MSIAAGVIGRPLIAAAVTLFEVAAERLGATTLHGLHDFEMRDRQPMVTAIGLTMGTKNIGQFNAASCRRLFTAGPHGLHRRER